MTRTRSYDFQCHIHDLNLAKFQWDIYGAHKKRSQDGGGRFVHVVIFNKSQRVDNRAIRGTQSACPTLGGGIVAFLLGEVSNGQSRPR